jgi:cephalosporin-C deacetylase-like acetyl esterase
MPSLLTSTFLLPIAKTILKKTGHDVVNLDIVGLVEKVKVPALFNVGDEDLITPNEKVFSIYKSYQGAPKKFLVVQGEHHTERDNGD